MPLPYNAKHITLAKNLRNRATPQENKLWYDFLCHYPVRFQRQKVIGDFIVDFYCAKAKLAIEIDGSQHHTAQGLQQDAARTDLLKNAGIHVIRFSNLQVEKDFNTVCCYIDAAVQDAISHTL